MDVVERVIIKIDEKDSKFKKCSLKLFTAIAKIDALSSGKIQKHNYLTSLKILTPQQNKIIEEAIFIYLSLFKAFQRQKMLLPTGSRLNEFKLIEKLC